MRPKIHVPFVLLTSLLAACGGGGGGDGASSAAPAAAATPVTVSASNYTTVVNEAAAATLTVTDLSSDANLLAGAAVQTEPNWAAWGLAKWRQWQAQAGNASIAGATITNTQACDSSSGTFSVSINDVAGNNQFDAGDSIAGTFNNCTLAGETMNGVVTLVLNGQPTGTLGFGTVYSLDMAMTFNNLTLVTPAFTGRAHGSLRLVSVRTAGYTGTDTITATSLASNATVGNTTRSRTLSGFTATVNISPTVTETTFSGTVVSSVLGGQSVSLSSTSAFLRRSGEEFAYQGAAQAVGSNGSKATVTVIDNTQVQIDLDADGNGTPEQSTIAAWANLL